MHDDQTAQERQWLLRALGHDPRTVTPTEQRLWQQRQRWLQTHDRAAYRAFKDLLAACPHAQVHAFRKDATNGAAHAYLRCASCGENPLGVGRFLSRAVLHGAGTDAWMLPSEEIATSSYDECVHCHQRLPGEYHHFAPVGRFRDPEQWPVAYLCVACHRHWHDVMGWGTEPWARKEQPEAAV